MALVVLIVFRKSGRRTGKQTKQILDVVLQTLDGLGYFFIHDLAHRFCSRLCFKERTGGIYLPQAFLDCGLLFPRNLSRMFPYLVSPAALKRHIRIDLPGE